MANGSFLGQKTKITVVRKLKLDDVAREYGQIRPGADNGDFIPDCPFFQEGQEFIVVTGGDQDWASPPVSATGLGRISGRTY